jgi:hypothetical protein
MPKQAVVFLCTTLAMGAVAFHLWRQLQDERELGQLPQVLIGTSVAPAPATAPETENVAAAAIANPGAATHASAATPCAPAPDVVAQLLPRYRKELQRLSREVLARNYPGLAAALNLAPADMAALLDLLQKHQVVWNSVPGYSGDDALIREELERASTEIPALQAAELAALLGPEKYRQWQEYQPMLNARRQVTLLLRNIRSSFPPLSDTQLELLAASMAAELRLTGSERGAMRLLPTDTRLVLEQEERDLAAREQGNARVLAAARAYLDEQQLSVLRETWASSIRSERVRLDVRRKQLE